MTAGRPEVRAAFSDPTRPGRSILLNLFENPRLAVGFPALMRLPLDIPEAQRLASKRPLSQADFLRLLGASGVAYPRIFLHALSKAGGLWSRDSGPGPHQKQFHSDVLKVVVSLSASAACGYGGPSIDTVALEGNNDFDPAVIERYRERFRDRHLFPGYRAAALASRKRGMVTLGEHEFTPVPPSHWFDIMDIAAVLHGGARPTRPSRRSP